MYELHYIFVVVVVVTLNIQQFSCTWNNLNYLSCIFIFINVFANCVCFLILTNGTHTKM